MAKIFIIISLLFFNCAYFNLFYNANKYFQEGLKTKNISEAQVKFNKAKEKSNLLLVKYPNSKWEGDALFIIAVSNYYLKEYKKALEQFELFLSYFPNHKKREDALYYQALTYLELKEYHKAIEILRKLSKKYLPLTKYQIALIYYLQKEYQIFLDSMLTFVNTFKKHPLRKEGLLKIAEVKKEMNKLSEAKIFYNELFKIEKDEKEKIKILIKIVDCLDTENKDTLKTYLRKLEKYLDKYSDLRDLLYLNIGKIYLWLKDDNNAFLNLKKVKGTEAQRAYYLIGERWEEKGVFDSALIYYDSSYLKGPTTELSSIVKWKKNLIKKLLNPTKEDTLEPAFYHFKLAEVYLLSLKDYSSALKEYEKIYKNYPNSRYALKAKFASAYIYYKEIDKEKGKNLFEEIIKEAPDSEYAKKAKEILKL
ncbi:MAG: tetratricopeptide repeat protein [candidate division WOR-3 bacterium]|nr:tetratricopeptide repeat protein [candidate division WOR-3 bacterium]